MNNSRFHQALKVLSLAAVLAFGMVATGTAEARGRVNFGVWVGGPLWWGAVPFGYGYPYVVERPIIVQPAEPMVIQPSVTQQSNLWYYCREAQMYYPYVTTCPSAWQEVPATPAPAAPAPAAAPAPVNRTPAAPVPPASK
jgi:hypothetical protein